MDGKKPYRKFKKPGKQLTTEQKIENFVIRNSKNGFFTKVKTISFKFEIPEDRTWDVVGELLSNGKIEATHDDHTGDMKLCETGKTYAILDMEQKRKKDGKTKRTKESRKTDKKKQNMSKKP